MSVDPRRALEALQSLAGQDLEQTPDDQLRREFIEDGLDPELEAKAVADRLDTVVAGFMRARASAAKALRAATRHPGPRQRPAIERIRAAIQAAFDREPELAAAFRQGRRQTDQDVVSLYDDLVAMGKIRSDDDGD